MARNRTVFAALALALAVVPACSDDNGVFIGDPVGDTVDEGTARGDAIADDAADELELTDFEITIGKTATILSVLNDGEIDQASFVAGRVAADDVFAYANDLVIDHDDANVALEGVVRSYGVPFLDSTTADTLAAEASAGLADLRASPPGDLEFTFVELQVINHAEALVLLDELAFQVGPGAMGDYISDTRAMMDDHLTRGEDLLETFF